MALRHVGEAVEPGREVGVLAGLHQAEMAFRHRQRRIARHRAEHRHSRCGHGIGDEPAMALAADPVEHDAGDAHGRVVGGDAAHHRGRRLRLAGHIEHEQHRQAEARARDRRWRRGGPAAPAMPSNRPMTPSMTKISAAAAASRASASSSAGAIAQLSRLTLGAPVAAAWKAGIDIVRPRLGRAHRDAAPPERGKQAERHRGLARARARRRDDEAARRHRDGSAAATARSFSRAVTMSPITTIAGAADAMRPAHPQRCGRASRRGRARPPWSPR